MSSESRQSVSEQPIVALPDYDNPPVAETFFSVAFSDLEKWSIPHFGLYWSFIRAEYPRFEVRPPLANQMETFGESMQPSADMLQLLTQPPVRCWYVHQMENRLIQVQNDRFIFNWRKMDPAEAYPRYEKALRGAFEGEWERFKNFLQSESIRMPEVEQCEISYINHIPNSGDWSAYESLVKALSVWPGSDPESEFLPTPEDVTFNARYRLPGSQSRLHVQLQPAVRNIDGKKLLQLTLTVRGRPSSSETSEMLSWFDLGREWIVRGFTDFTSEEMHNVWKRRK
jgi:uncharacterized protein (TIGR04255 family)